MNADQTAHLMRHWRDAQTAEVTRDLRRIRLQLAFATRLTDRLGRDDWRPLLDAARADVAAITPADGPGALPRVAAQVEQRLAPIGAVAKSYTIWLIAHGHIDMNWMWSWPETVSSTLDTFASVLGLMDEYPQLHYSQSQTSVYEIARRYHPRQFAQIAERIAEGRWEVTASQWVEGEKNMINGESLARHLLLTRAFMAEHFGLTPEDVPIDWAPDTFGHAPTIPSILAQAGVRYYYSCRQGGGFDHHVAGSPRPPVYWWEAPDGARVLVCRETTWYNSYVNIGEDIAAALLDFEAQTGLRDWLNVYGIGNHGGGPTRTELDYFGELATLPIYPTLRWATARGWFETIAAQGADLPVVRDELNFEFTGCYTSQSLIKTANRHGENYLLEAETLAATAERRVGVEVPASNLREGWRRVLFHQFHDVLPGSCVRPTREHALSDFQEVGAITGAAKRVAGWALAADLDTASLLPDTPAAAEERELLAAGHANTAFVAGAGIGAGLSGLSSPATGGRRFQPFVIYNPCAWARTERVTVSLWDTDLDAGRLVARDDEGRQVPVLVHGRGHEWGHERLTVSFEAREVPGLGYRTYLLCEGTADPVEGGVTYGPRERFDTPYLGFRLGRHTGGALLDLVDHRTGAQYGAPRDGQVERLFGFWESVVERPWMMNAWVLGEEDLAAARVVRSRGLAVHGGARNQATLAASGGSPAYRAECHAQVPGTHSSVRLTYTIANSEPRLDVVADLDWREIGDAERGIPGLVLSLPCDQLGALTTRYELPYGSLVRDLPDGSEVPSNRYAHVGGQGPRGYAGVTLLQDCRYGHALRGAELRLRMVRSSYEPDPTPEVARQQIRYSLYFWDREPSPAELTRLGQAWNHPLIALPANLQSGANPTLAAGLQVCTDNVVLTAAKKAEAGDGLVLRLNELNGTGGPATVELSPELAAGLTRAVRLDLLEREVEGAARLEGTRLTVDLPAHGLATVGLY